MVSKSKWMYGVALVVLSIGMLGLLSGCPEEPSVEDGTITIRVTGAVEHVGKNLFCGVFATGAEPIPANSLGQGCEEIIAGGTVEIVVMDPAAGITPVVFTGGNSYDAWCFIDVNGDDDYTNGDYTVNELKTVVVDGDMVVELVYPTDFTEVTGIP